MIKPVFWLWLGMIVLMVGCGPVAAESATYQGELGGLDLTVKYPPAWQVEETADSLTLHSVGEEAETAAATTVTVKTIPLSMLAIDDLTELMRYEVDTLATQRRIALRDEITETTVNGKEAVTAVLDAGDGATFRYTIIRAETALAFVLGEVDAQATESDLEQVEEIIHSIEVSAVTQ